MKIILILFTLFIGLINSSAQTDFEQNFFNKTLRLDFCLAGNATTSLAFLTQLYEEPYWGGRQTHLDSSLRLGDFLVLLQDDKTHATIYEEGFSTLFEEWQDTQEALQISRSFANCVIMPYPKNKVILNIIKRQNGLFTDTLLQITVDTTDKKIARTSPPNFQTDTLVQNEAPENALDIVILAEGFQASEMKKFEEISQQLAQTLLTSQVFEKNKARINFYAIHTPSKDSGVDNPLKNEWKSTAFDASFNTLNSERYLMANNTKAIRDAAALVPYDQIYIIMNTEKYGGGGIYNFYSTYAADSRSNAEVLIHEFGHRHIPVLGIRRDLAPDNSAPSRHVLLLPLSNPLHGSTARIP